MCQYTPDNKRTKNTNQTKMCAIMVFYVYFVLYIELLFGNVDLNGSLKVHETKTLSIMDSNFATANRCGCYLIQKRWILLTGEIDADFTNTKIYTSYNALRSPVVPFCNTNFIALDEDGIGYIGNFLIDGRIRIEVRSYIPEYKKQILRFSCIAFASI